jgi:hypothetical protein
MSEIAVSSLPPDVFSPTVARNIDPRSPVPVRLMAAKGLIACPPRELLMAVYQLTFDPEPKVSETARAFAGAMPDKLLAGLRDEELPATVLTFYAHQLRNNERAMEMVALNVTTPDESVAELAEIASDAVVEIISQNQLRILRDERIVRAIVRNPNTRIATKDTLLDFCVRSGLSMPDVPEYVDARRRIFGEEPAVAAVLVESEKHTVEKVVADLGEAITSEAAPELPEGKKLTFTQRIMKMSVSERIKLATLGNKEARTVLLRDSNKLVCLAAVTSPRLTDAEVVALSSNRTLHEEVMRYISTNREWLKMYQVKVNLVNNPKLNPGAGLRFLQFLHEPELKAVARNKNISAVLQTAARRALQPKRK